MFDGIAEHEGRKTELANAMFFMKLLIFSTVSSYLFLFNDLI